MAIIYSYPQYAPKPEDLLIGTVTLDENAAVPIYDNPTVSFTIQSLLDMIAPITGAQNLQQVTNIGATTSNTVTFTSDIKVTGRFYDSSGSPGLAGQVLSSTVTGTLASKLPSTWLDIKDDSLESFMALDFISNEKQD